MTDDPGAREPSARVSSPRRGLDRKLLAAIALSVFMLVAALTYTLLGAGRGECRNWEGQLETLSRSLTRLRLAKGEGRMAAITALDELELPCAKVAVVRDECAEASRQLARAEQQQLQAKGLLGQLEGAVDRLDEPARSVAKRRLLQSETLVTIADDLDLTPDQARRSLDTALEQLDPGRLEKLQGEIEAAIERSEKHVEIGAIHNKRCDRGFKLLIDQGQRR